jgi:hypothetical protein
MNTFLAKSPARPLRSKLLPPLVAAVITLLVVTFFGMSLLINRQVELRLRERGQAIALAIVSAAENLDQLSELPRIVTAIAAEPGVELVMMVSGPEPQVIASSQRRWLGKNLGDLPVKRIGEDLENALASRTSGEGQWHRQTDEYDWTVFCRPVFSRAEDFKPSDGAVMVHGEDSGRRAAIHRKSWGCGWRGSAVAAGDDLLADRPLCASAARQYRRPAAPLRQRTRRDRPGPIP